MTWEEELAAMIQVLEEMKSSSGTRLQYKMEVARLAQEEVARREGISCRSVSESISEMVRGAWTQSKADPKGMAKWIAVMGAIGDEPPTNEEFIAKAAAFIKKNSSS